MLTVWIMGLWASQADAVAGDFKKWRCRSGGEKRVLRVPKSCEASFRTYAKDLTVGLGASMGAKGEISGEVGAEMKTVQLQLDALNKDLRTHYVALCMGWTSPDPCDPAAIRRYNDGRRELAESAAGLRRAVAEAQSREGGVEELERALSEHGKADLERDEELAARLDAIRAAIDDLDRSATADEVEAGSPIASLRGSWALRLDRAPGQTCGPATVAVDAVVLEGEEDWKARVVLASEELGSETVDLVVEDGHLATPEHRGGIYQHVDIEVEDDGSMTGVVKVYQGGMLGCLGAYTVHGAGGE